MKRAWDIIVGVLMILASLVFQAVMIPLVVGFVCAGIGSYYGIGSQRWIFVCEGIAFVLLNVLSFVEFGQGKIAKITISPRAGIIFLLPRGVFRIFYGRETYHEMVQPGRGFEVLPSKPDDAAS